MEGCLSLLHRLVFLGFYIFPYVCVCVCVCMKELATHSSIFAWEIPRTKAPHGVHGVGKESDMT